MAELNFIGEGSSHNFLEVLPKNLTLEIPGRVRVAKRRYAHYHDSYRPINGTIFREVLLETYDPKWDEDKVNIPIVKTTLEDVYNALKKFVKDNWKDDIVVGHSSGYDSRVMSKIISELGLKARFMECLGEREGFREIMKVRGFEGMIHNEEQGDPSEHHEKSFDFEIFYQKFNGVCSFPVNQWYDAYVGLGEFTGMTGYGANETMEYVARGKGLAWYYQWHYYLQLSSFRFENWLQPFRSKEVIQAVLGCDLTEERMSKRLADTFVPECKHIPHTSIADLKPYRELGGEIMIKALTDYTRSWYGKRVSATPSNILDYGEWWMHYNIASLCEYLISKGHKIALV